MAYIKKKSERKFKITVCNGYKVNGQKRMKAQTITVPSSVPKRGIQQYVMAEAERIEKKFKYGVEESDQTHFEQCSETAISICEKVFNDRLLANSIASQIGVESIDTNHIIEALKTCKNSILKFLSVYPTYFSARINWLCR